MNISERSAPLKKFILLLILLNALDGILTYIGMTQGIIGESNPLLSSFTPFTILSLKLFLSLSLLCLLFTSFGSIRTKFWRFTLILTNALYFMILALHLYWLPFLFS